MHSPRDQVGMVVHIRVLLAAEIVNMMTLREAQIFFSLPRMVGQDAAAGVMSRD